MNNGIYRCSQMFQLWDVGQFSEKTFVEGPPMKLPQQPLRGKEYLNYSGYFRNKKRKWEMPEIIRIQST